MQNKNIQILNEGEYNTIEVDESILFKMRTSEGRSIIDLDTGRPVNYPKDIVIGNHVWVGEDEKFLKGSSIPNNCVVGAYSVVTKNLKLNSV